VALNVHWERQRRDFELKILNTRIVLRFSVPCIFYRLQMEVSNRRTKYIFYYITEKKKKKNIFGASVGNFHL
jgi:hypothetical protein